MRKLLPSLFCCLNLAIFVRTSAHTAARPGDLFFAPFFQDAKDSSSKPAPATVKKGVLKKLTEKVEFKKKARENEKQRMITVVEALGLKDSIAAASNNTQSMIQEMAKKETRHFDELQKMIEGVKASNLGQPGLPPSVPVDPKPGPVLPVKIPNTPEGNQPATDADEGEKQQKEKQEALRKIKVVKLNGPGIIQLQKGSDSVVKRFRVSLNNKAEVFGFYDAGMPLPLSLPSMMGSLSSLVYYSLPINGATGDMVSLNGWDSSPVITAAQDAGCKVYFTALLENKGVRASLLYNALAQQTCIANLVALLRKRSANGVVISFKNLTREDRNPFAKFIQLVSKVLRQGGPGYELIITLPRYDQEGAYDVQTLKACADKFFIDFATNTARFCGPLDPLRGSSSINIENSASWYESMGIRSNKLVLVLPYRGACWELANPAMKQDHFSGYLPLGKIRDQFGDSVFYDEKAACAYADSISADNRPFKIWFNDATTLSQKYDFILDNYLGGAGLYCINDQEDLKDLKDELEYKFTVIDTLYLQDSIIARQTELSFFQKLRRYLALSAYILENPCATCFEHAGRSTQEKELLLSYIKELEIDSLACAEKNASQSNMAKQAGRRTVVSLKDQFNYINHRLNRTLLCITLVLLLVSIGMIILYIRGRMLYGEGWPSGKTLSVVLIVLNALLVLFAFTYCFTDDLIPVFGASGGFSPAAECATDLRCVNMPYSTLLVIVAVSMVAGLLLFRYLITALLKKEDLP